MRPVSETRAAILRFMVDYCRRHYVPPSIREISDGVGLASTSTVAYHLEALIARGYLARVGPEFGSRGIVPAEVLALVVTEANAA